MGCNCSSDYSDDEFIENLDEICEHCNCPIPPESCNAVSVFVHVCAYCMGKHVFVGFFIHTYRSV